MWENLHHASAHVATPQLRFRSLISVVLFSLAPVYLYLSGPRVHSFRRIWERRDTATPPRHLRGSSEANTQWEKKHLKASHDVPTTEHSADAAEGSVQGASRLDLPVGNEGRKATACLKHIIYDKPVKTASTSIAFAIREYLDEQNKRSRRCDAEGQDSCLILAERLCNGTYSDEQMFSVIGHLKWTDGKVVECLRKKGYYAVTSIRDPYQRRKSAYLWNRTMKAAHYKIPYTVPFAEFMDRLPRCVLHNDYDGLGHHCEVGGVTLHERIRRIVDRFDEVIDVYNGGAGPLQQNIKKFLGRENESEKPDKGNLAEFKRDTLEEETMLYQALKEKQKLIPDPGRMLC